MKLIDVISIDLDDTLWPINPVIKRAEKRLRRWLRANCPRVELNPETDHFLTLRKKILDIHPDRGHDFAFQRRAGLAMLLEPAGYDASVVEAAYKVFASQRNEVELYDDVLPALERLSQEYRLLAITNGSADLEQVGIARHFEHTIRASDVGVAKPEPEIFAAAAAAAGVPAERIMHIGDAPIEDVAGANRAGMTAVWMNRFGRTWPKEHPPPVAEIGRLSEIHVLLQSR